MFGLIVAIPLLAIAYLGYKIAHDDGALLAQQRNKIHHMELQQVARALQHEIQNKEKLFRHLSSPHRPSPESLRLTTEEQRFVKQFFILNAIY